MKRYTTILLIFLFVFAAPSLVSAEDEERYAASITNDLGLELRMLQLERSIDTRLVLMSETLTQVDDEELEETTALLVELRDEVRESEATREAFTQSRVLAREYVTSFRERMNELDIDDETRVEIRQNAQEELQFVRQEYSERTRELATSYNKERARQLAERAGLNADEVANQVTSDMRRSDVAALVRERLAEQRQEILSQIREERRAQAAEHREIAQRTRSEATALREERRNQINEVRETANRARDRRSVAERPRQPTVDLSFIEVDYDYDGNSFEYDVTVESPNQCYDISSQARSDRSMNPTVTINVQSEQVSRECPQVITRLNDADRLEISNLARVVVLLDGERVYTNDIQSTDQTRDTTRDVEIDDDAVDDAPRDEDDGAARERSQIRSDSVDASYDGTRLAVTGEAVLPNSCFELEVADNLENGEVSVYHFAVEPSCPDVVSLQEFSASLQTDNPPSTVVINGESFTVRGLEEVRSNE